MCARHGDCLRRRQEWPCRRGRCQSRLSWSPAAGETYKELSAQSASFKKIYESMVAFRRDSVLWDEVAEGTYSNYMMEQQRKNLL